MPLNDGAKLIVKHLIDNKRYTQEEAEKALRRVDGGIWEALSHIFGLNLVTSDALPWAKTPLNRCRAVLQPNDKVIYWGRCDLTKHSTDMDHALERGFDTIRWSTRLTDAPGT